MRLKLLLVALALIAAENGFAQKKENKPQDWLISGAVPYQSRIAVDGQNIVLDNGLVRRSFGSSRMPSAMILPT
ncbi:hypothetical protein KUH03_01125 [Sphingobacterium sp. E70]|uniref:hypothetical protein n=1 Tax=Sphingobacterium sp. E70 TaxID=2853439 RepID=UPI00211C50C5|nr:hypothetical protein [Sphingobacterium sp. E70]ULT25644.1 hypothetical protein KUH03_01125 [Sphingobacterium sp. E70]